MNWRTGLVLVQGSRAFAEWLHNGYLLNSLHKQITVISDLEYTTADGFQVSHAEVGGVTSGKWSVYVQGLSCHLDTSMHVRRQLRHVLKTTEKASHPRELKKSSTALLRPNQLLPFGWKTPTVRCPSVFNKNADELRLMTVNELMDAYDLELTLTVGGVTSGKWSVYVQGLSCHLDTSMHVRRQLRHVLKTTEKASHPRELRKSSTALLWPNQLLPFGWKTPTVRCPSVFNKNADVLRLMTVNELMDAYDLELNSQSQLYSFWKSSESTPTLGFTSQAPLKVLRRILESTFNSVVHFGRNSSEKYDTLSCDSSLETVCHSNMDKTRGVSLGDDDTVLTEYTDKTG